MISTPQQTARAPARGSWKIAKWPSPEIEDLANKSKWVYVQAGSHTLGLRGGRARMAPPHGLLKRIQTPPRCTNSPATNRQGSAVSLRAGNLAVLSKINPAPPPSLPPYLMPPTPSRPIAPFSSRGHDQYASTRPSLRRSAEHLANRRVAVAQNRGSRTAKKTGWKPPKAAKTAENNLPSSVGHRRVSVKTPPIVCTAPPTARRPSRIRHHLHR